MTVITIVSPCYQEEDSVERCYETVRQIFDEKLPHYQREHIFADNASSDGTVAILRRITASDHAVKVVVNSRNFGVFRSTFNGLKYATGDAVLLMLPVDLQDPPELIPDFVALWEQGYQVVAGARIERQEGTAMRAFRRLFYLLVNRLADFDIPENVGEFQLVDRKASQLTQFLFQVVSGVRYTLTCFSSFCRSGQHSDGNTGNQSGQCTY